jgi:hypothetical protein
MSTARHIFIGDIHGCADELEHLLKVCNYSSSDVLCFVGDLVAKGPHTGAVVRLARELGALSVRGNHDERLLVWHTAHQRELSGGDKPAPLKPHHQEAQKQLTPADWEYLHAQPDYRRFPELNVIMVHAGLVPGVPLAKQPRDLMHNMRTIKPNGEGGKKHTDGKAWAPYWKGPERVVFGHDAVLGLQKCTFATGLDTGCCYGRELTALILPEDILISVPAKRAYTAAD